MSNFPQCFDSGPAPQGDGKEYAVYKWNAYNQMWEWQHNIKDGSITGSADPEYVYEGVDGVQDGELGWAGPI